MIDEGEPKSGEEVEAREGFVQELGDDDELHFYIRLDDGLKLEIFTREGAKTIFTVLIAAKLFSSDKYAMLTIIHRANLSTEAMTLDEVLTLATLFRLRPHLSGLAPVVKEKKAGDLHHNPPPDKEAE